MKRMKTNPRMLCFAVIASALGACGSALEAERIDGNTTAKIEAQAPAPNVFERAGMSVADVSEAAVPSVVNISIRKKVKASLRRMPSPFFSDPLFRHFFEGRPDFQRPPDERLERSLGSGVIVRTDGTILTNNHVVEDAEEVVVTLHDKREYRAKITGKDPPSDLAVLKLEDPPKDLEALPLGDSDSLRLGEIVVAIGNPFGMGQTVTMGIASAKGRANVGIVDYEDFIQTDAAINPGNSGGALLNLRGELVGINTAILSRSGGYQGIGFAIPSNMARSIMGSLIEDGKVVRGFLGVMIQDLTSEIAKAMDAGVTEGVLVSEVVEDSPADKAGVKAGDIIVKVDDRKVATSAKLRNVIAAMGAGRRVDLDLIRDGDARTVTVELTEKAGEDAPVALDEDAGPLGGVTIEPLTDDSRRKFDVSERVDVGVVVTDVSRGPAAARAGIRPGDVILGVNQRAVKTPSEFQAAYAKAGDRVLLRIHRKGGALFLVLKK